MTTDTTTATAESQPAADAAVQETATKAKPEQNMLKVLGYLAQRETDPSNIELPGEESQTEGGEAEAATTEAAAPEQGATTGEGEAKPEGEQSVAENATEAADEKPKPEAQQRARKRKNSAMEQLPDVQSTAAEQPVATEPTADAIESAVERALKKAQEATSPKANDAALPPEDRKAIDLAEYAAKSEPAKFADLPAKQRAFIQARNQHVAEWLKENQVSPGSPEFAEYLSSPEYLRFVRSNNPIPHATREELKERQIRESAVNDAKQEFAKQQAEMERKLRRLEVQPIIHQAAAEVHNNVLDVDDDVVKRFRDNPQETLDANPVEAPIIHEIATEAKQLTTEYLEISQGLKDPDQRNPVHHRLDRFIEERGQQLESIPEDKRMRNGKVLVSHARYREMVAKRDPRLRNVETLTPTDIVNLIQETHKGAISIRLQAHRKDLEKAGYTRVAPNTAKPTQQKTATESAKATAKPESASPKAIATRAAGPSSKPAAANVPLHMKALGYASAAK